MAEEFDLISYVLSILMWAGIGLAVLFVFVIAIKLLTDSLIENAANSLVATVAGGIATILLGGPAGRIVSFLVGTFFSWGSFRKSVDHWRDKRKEWKAKRIERRALRKEARAEWWKRQKERFSFRRPSLPKVSIPKVSVPKLGNPLSMLRRKPRVEVEEDVVEPLAPVEKSGDDGVEAQPEEALPQTKSRWSRFGGALGSVKAGATSWLPGRKKNRQ